MTLNDYLATMAENNDYYEACVIEIELRKSLEAIAKMYAEEMHEEFMKGIV